MKVVDLVRTSGGELNFNDALIALACEDRQIVRLASFDRDFDTIPWISRVSQASDLE